MNSRKIKRMNNLQFASATLLEKFRDNNSCSLIPENKACKIMDFQNYKIVIIASCSSGADGVKWVTAYKVVPKDIYKNSVYTYDEHVKAIIEGTIERGYTGIEIITKKGKMVISGEAFTIKPVQILESQQLSLFN